MAASIRATGGPSPFLPAIAEKAAGRGAQSKRGNIAGLALFWIGTTALFGALALVIQALGADTYSGVDGKFNQDLITTYLSFARPFEVNSVNPLEGVFSQLYPINICLNPGFLPFFIFDHEIALVISTAIFLLIYCLATYALARSASCSIPAAIIGAQIAAFAFPPLYYQAGLFSNYDLNPGASLTVTLFTLLLCTILQLNELSWRGFGVALLLSVALVGCIVFNDPLTMGLIGFSFLVPFGVAVLEGRRIFLISLRLLVLTLTGLIFYLLGLVDYVLAMDHYTSRYYLRGEYFRPQAPDFVSALFDFPQAWRTYAFLLIGWLVGLLFCRGRPRILIIMALLNFLWLILYGSVYLFGPFHWFAPLPIYVETYTIHIGGLAAAVGWVGLLLKAVRAVPTSWKWLARPALRNLTAAMIVPVLIAAYGLRIPTSMKGINHEDWVHERELVDYLRDAVGLYDGAQFRGTVYVNAIGYRDQ
ncbi:MAG TPA: hypothetical protein VH593_33975, partial [Ktedonobacteraceae bacterium]